MGELDPFTRLTARQSTLAIATTDETAKRVRHLGAFSVNVASQVALSTLELEALGQVKAAQDGPIRFVSIGRLIHWKGFHLGVSAFAQAKIPDSEYWIIGEGAEKPRLEKLTQDLGVHPQVKFLGKLNREELFIILNQCHVLVHPSLHDSGGQVCAEMMAAKRPVICLDLGGPALQVTEATGIKISAHDPEQTITDMAKAMNRLANNPALRSQMGEAGQQRVNTEFSWDFIGQSLTKTYKAVSDSYNSP